MTAFDCDVRCTATVWMDDTRWGGDKLLLGEEMFGFQDDIIYGKKNN